MGRLARSLWLALSLSVVFALAATPDAFAEQVKDLPKPTAYVTDLAGVLSESAKVEINQYAGEVERQAHAQIAVVIIKSLDGKPIEDYSNNLFHTWGIGSKDAKYKDRGLLLLFATNDRKRRIEVGLGLEGILPDAKAGDIGRDMRPLLQQNNWDDAVKLGVTEAGQVIAADAGVTIAPPEQPAHTYRRERVPQRGGGIGFGALIVGFIVFMVIIGILRRLFGGGGRGGPGSGGGLGSWLPWLILGNLMGGGGRSWGDSGGRGSWGGGRDSGGSSDGGFGGFGGGDSGGGGASGDW